MLCLDRIFLNHPKFESVVMHQKPLPEKPVYKEAISGAFMLVRRSAMEDVGLMDEGYFLHCEDLDWCMRFRQKGWKILFVPDVEVIHAKGVCSHPRPVRVEWHKHKGMVRFYRKFFRHQYPFLLMWCVIGAVWLRFGVLAVLFTLRRLKP
jgi:GT2 family glycosyltransferase